MSRPLNQPMNHAATAIESFSVRPYLDRYTAKRKITNATACGLIFLSALIALFPLASVLLYVTHQGLPALNWQLFTELPKAVGETGGGLANALVGTLMLVTLASLVGIPVGVATALCINEFKESRFKQLVEFSVDMLASLPSIVIGLFAYAAFVIPMKRFSVIAGSAALAFIMIPIVARSAAEILRLVPANIREAGLALGLPRYVVILRIILRGSLSGILTGVILAIARVAGETAPLLFTALNNRFWNFALDQPISSLPVQIYTYAISPYEDWQQKAWAGALLLVGVVFCLNLLTRLVFSRGVPKK